MLLLLNINDDIDEETIQMQELQVRNIRSKEKEEEYERKKEREKGKEKCLGFVDAKAMVGKDLLMLSVVVDIGGQSVAAGGVAVGGLDILRQVSHLPMLEAERDTSGKSLVQEARSSLRTRSSILEILGEGFRFWEKFLV
ncbi:hypothetical protein FNV43_RR00479 [Rhamnella rubrinervis]|uniref:Uncharacterized protein n=1 Tax=Rhamnella rubrinervis TaxID=2594499 RepID=A0A8K0HMY3_9ROSA|nr:hypothetical protein FNV43_RR00479 [Rhamnella rubrinervis]